MFRFATREDCPLILEFIIAIAKYEKMEKDVVATAELLEEWIFDKKSARVIFAIADGVEVGFAVFCQNFSTFLGRAGLYLEDVYVKPEYRGRGIGYAILCELARIAVAEGFGRMEWQCLDWNSPSIDFYLGLGAIQMHEWSTYRLAGDSLLKLAAKNAEKR
ncbi:MAG: GNAT family N-acetyltransferase [Defluviitaleaceae bacterium]|nr:GNAT family N-acetyltransferase [Defluviitaleaceae bacterium]